MNNCFWITWIIAITKNPPTNNRHSIGDNIEIERMSLSECIWCPFETETVGQFGQPAYLNAFRSCPNEWLHCLCRGCVLESTHKQAFAHNEPIFDYSIILHECVTFIIPSFLYLPKGIVRKSVDLFRCHWRCRCYYFRVSCLVSTIVCEMLMFSVSWIFRKILFKRLIIANVYSIEWFFNIELCISCYCYGLFLVYHAIVNSFNNVLACFEALCRMNFSAIFAISISGKFSTIIRTETFNRNLERMSSTLVDQCVCRRDSKTRLTNR